MRTKCRRLAVKRSLILLLVLVFSWSLIDLVQAALINSKLSGDLVLGGDVISYRISPDGKYAVFAADARTNNIVELFSVTLTGGRRLRISGALPVDSEVQGFRITPDSQSVVYWTKNVDGYCTGIFVSSIAGGEVLNISESVPEFSSIVSSRITADNQYFVYALDYTEPATEWYESLWAAPLDGSGSFTLNIPRNYDGQFYFEVLPAGSDVIVQRFGSGPILLYLADMEGGAEPLDEFVYHFVITPDGDRVVYAKYDDQIGVFSISSTGVGKIRLSGDMVLGGEVVNLRIAPNSQQVVYLADEVVDDRVELFSAPVDGSTERKQLLDVMISGGDVIDFQITPNSQGVVYLADQVVDNRVDLRSVSINGGISYWLSKEMVPGGIVRDYAITANSLGVVFRADKLVDDKDELFAVSIVGTLLTRLNTELPAGGDVMNFKISPNGQGVLYRADQVVNDIINLYAVPVTGGVIPVRVNNQLTLGGTVQDFVITPDSQGALYLADQDTDGVDELYATFDRQIIFLPQTSK